MQKDSNLTIAKLTNTTADKYAAEAQMAWEEYLQFLRLVATDKYKLHYGYIKEPHWLEKARGMQ